MLGRQADAIVVYERLLQRQPEQPVALNNLANLYADAGRHPERALEMARRAGFQTVANSLFHANSARTDRYDLGRVAMLRDLQLEEFSATCQGRGLWKKRIVHGARRTAQRLLGNDAYDRLRAAALGESEQ